MVDPDIDDQFLDVDFTEDPNYVFGDNGVNLFGDCEFFEDAEEVYDDAQVRAACELQEANGSLEWFVRSVFDQGREGSCVGNAATKLFETMLEEHLGVGQGIDLSAISLYKQIGRSASSGASVSDAFVRLQDTGVLPLDTPKNRARFGEHVMPATGFSTRFPDGWKETAKKFRIAGGKAIRSLAGLKTALAKGRGVVVGREGHSIFYVGIRWKGGRYVVPYLNSWRETWGQAMGRMKGGFGWDSESQIKKSASWCFCIDSSFLN